ncbi:conserved hypothetical protein [Histoplasma capsulatum var. duboisii H88]|uniref:Autophagy-related protein Atg28 n=2 Tax=Ajellomyces capsulatus TaxID=5037 RepID=F0U4K3_AJEC8|nr:conserved hypothetical protein [Histoplasma capsulatum H143]EGC41160.1 conserved hypothetical protein [Histoplasma capsulatum var. duboisii H88]QSS52418.1 autophagy-related protein Atg28 [Histoplasma capsulatum var. duboisii H88]
MVMSILLPYDSGQERLAPFPPDVAVHHYDSFMHIERQSRQLQRDLQTLLDAQSTGLAAGLSRPTGDDTTSNGSLTPTPTPTQLGSNPRNTITIPVRQPVQKKIGLRGARRGILKAMHALLSLKEEERRLIDSELKNRRLAVKEVETFVNKQSGLGNAIAEIQTNDGSLRAENLIREARTLETDIRDLESKLLQMKVRHRHVLNEVSQIQNSVDAQLSSYKASLALVQTDVNNYLRSPPIRPLVPPTATPPPFYALNPDRRTLEMAKEQWIMEQNELRSKRRKADLEIEALREGGGVWQKAVSDISSFEKLLQREMRSLQQGSQFRESRDEESNIAKRRTVLDELDDTTSQLETSLQLAEQKSWNLLICCIGAELEAFREAKPLLLESFSAFNKTRDKNHGLSKESVELSQHSPENTSVAACGEIQEPKEPFSPSKEKTATQSPHSLIQSSRSEEDDEPDPAWLLS